MIYNNTDEELIKQIIDGREEAITILIQRYQGFAFNLASKILTNKQDAEESVQDSFVKAIKAIIAFKQESSFKTWLYRIVYNTAMNQLRKKSFISKVLIDDLSDAEIQLHNELMESKYDKIYITNKIKYAFDKLTPENKIIMTLYYLEQATIDEISEITLLTNNTVKVRLFRSREQLKKILKRLDLSLD